MKRDWKVWAPPLVILTGAVVGVLGAVLTRLGNPPNMGLCIACFQRDIVGALGLHRAGPVQYLRPEIPALVLGVVLAATLSRELRARSAPSPALSLVLGGLVMVGALVFLGCPIRMTLRLAGGDLNALEGFAGFGAGIWVGTAMLRRGFSLGRSAPAALAPTLVLPTLAIGLLVLVIARPAFIFASSKGPGSMAAPVLASVGAGVVLGFLAQRARLCFVGGVRDMLLIRSPHLLVGLVAALLVAWVANLALGQFKFGFADQPIAHTAHLWSFLGMALVGLGSVLLGGCPMRQ
ncbi:MAG: YedE-related selenium metabolism membrane protein, partial [Planctomycetes bacterium]|nr:YedE-related selenium metabolism membrane protein [Planctomycetota bacterium]